MDNLFAICVYMNFYLLLKYLLYVLILIHKI
jgi:hypothetical protein